MRLLQGLSTEHLLAGGYHQGMQQAVAEQPPSDQPQQMQHMQVDHMHTDGTGQPQPPMSTAS